MGKERASFLVKGVDSICRKREDLKKALVWRKNGRLLRLEYKENAAGRFLSVSVRDADGTVCILEGRDLLKRMGAFD